MNSKNSILIVCLALYMAFSSLQLWAITNRGPAPEKQVAQISAVASPMAARKVEVAPTSIQPAVKAPVNIRPVDENGIYHVDSTYETFTVCVGELAIKDNPGDQFPALSYLHEGDQVQIIDRSKGVLGWALIDGSKGHISWVKESGLCR